MQHSYEQPGNDALPIKVWGMDADGVIFRQSVNARDITEYGALLEGLPRRLNLGDFVGVQYQQQKARAKVTGIEETAKDCIRDFSVRLIESSRCPWKSALVQVPISAAVRERRRFTRYNLSVGLELQCEGSDVPTYLKTSDVSVGGCYIETMLPFAKNTALEIRMWLSSGKLLTKGIIRTSIPSLGMGIEFIDMTSAEIDLLGKFLQSHVVSPN